MTTPYDWQVNANCRNENQDIFFNDDKKDKTYQRICGECVVRAECLEYALVYDMQGTWGGMTQRERSRLDKRNTQALRDDLDESGMYNKKLKV